MRLETYPDRWGGAVFIKSVQRNMKMMQNNKILTCVKELPFINKV